MIKLPEQAIIVLNELEKNGYEAYLVGGFVRDLILSRETHDIDCATNALPDEIERVFSNFKQSQIGKDHGTIGVKIKHDWIEITTYRFDDETKDHRRPKSVTYAPSLKEDVIRRDFTINALAINQKGEIIDYVNGQEDIKQRIIRCVGNPEYRFYEDALRILRGIRFACQLNFEIEKNTLEAMHKQSYLLNALAVERIYQEFKLMLESDSIYPYFNSTKDILNVFIPEILDLDSQLLMKIDQCNTWLKRFSLFFIHQNEEKIRIRANHLKMPKKLIKDSVDFYYCYNHEYNDQEIDIKRMMQVYPKTIILEAMELKKIIDPEHYSEKSYQLLLKMIQDNVVISIKDLNINGHDLLNMNIKGKAIQETLNACLEAVMLNKVENTKEALIQWVNLTSEQGML
jgi:tRNA nucleotidyltransferase (CCA-adding enzyme)